MEIAVSRRDLHGAIACAGSERDGLAPPSKIAEGIGNLDAKRRDFSPMSSALTFTTEHEDKVDDEGTMPLVGATKSLRNFACGPVSLVHTQNSGIKYKKPLMECTGASCSLSGGFR